MSTKKGVTPESVMRSLSTRKRQALVLFYDADIIGSKEVAHHFGLHMRSAANVCKKWADEGFLEVQNPNSKTRYYKLGKDYLILLGL